jgi:hypothetical protein
MSTLRTFAEVFRQYHAHHGIRYSLATAWRVAVLRWPF